VAESESARLKLADMAIAVEAARGLMVRGRRLVSTRLGLFTRNRAEEEISVRPGSRGKNTFMP